MAPPLFPGITMDMAANTPSAAAAWLEDKSAQETSLALAKDPVGDTANPNLLGDTCAQETSLPLAEVPDGITANPNLLGDKHAQETSLPLAKDPDGVTTNPNFHGTERIQWMEAEIQKG